VPTIVTDVAQTPEPTARSEGISGAGLADKLTKPPMVVILWLGVIFHSFALLHQLPSRPNHFDFSIYYASGLAMREHIDPYTTDLNSIAPALNLEIEPMHYATDPPGYILAFEPLTLLPLRQAFWLWEALNLAALMASLVLLFKGSGLGVWPTLAVAALALLYPPIGEHFFYGQNKIFVLLMLALMIRWMADGHDALAGLILGVAVLMRGFPLLMVGYLLVRRRWRIITYATLGIVMGALVTLAILGLPQTLSFTTGLRTVTMPRFLAVPINVSLGAFVSRMYWYAFGPRPGLSSLILRVLVIAAQLGLIALTVKATAKSRDTDDLDWRAFSLWVVTAVLIAPTAWVHYLVLMLIPFVMMAIAAGRGRANRRAIWMALASVLLIALSTSARTAFGPHPHGVLPVMVAECSFLSLLMVYISAYWFASDEPALPSK
jgi:hypothetical protein